MTNTRTRFDRARNGTCVPFSWSCRRIATWIVNKVTSPSTNVFALLSKKSYPRSTRLPTWRWREWRRRILGCLWNRYKVEKASTQALRKDSRYFWHHFSWRVSNKVQVWHNRATSLSSRIQKLVFFLKSYHTSCHRLITTAAGSS